MVKLKGTGKQSPKIFKIRIKMVEKKVRPLLKKGLTKSLPVIKITGRIEAAKADTKKGTAKKWAAPKKTLDDPPEGEYNRGVGWRTER